MFVVPPCAYPSSERTNGAPSLRQGYFAHVRFSYDDRLVQKNYHGVLSDEWSERLIAAHDRWVEALRGVGIRIPPTSMRLVESAFGARVCVTQERFAEAELAWNIVQKGSADEVIAVGHAALDAARQFADSPLYGKVGFNPRLKNCAYRNGLLYYFDTFPPLVSFDIIRESMILHAKTWRLRTLVKLFPEASRALARDHFEFGLMLASIVLPVRSVRPHCAAVLDQHARGMLVHEDPVQLARYSSAVDGKLSQMRVQRLLGGLVR